MNASTVTCCFVASAFSVALSLSGCANLTVTKVSADNDATTKGVRYYLPKPYLQVTPQPDGTISVDVIFLPDKQREYAIDTSSHFSSYTFQIARDEKGLLTSLEYKASTTAVGQQLASSGGAYAAQSYNIKAAGLVAVQAQVNSAQTSLDTARTSEASAEAALASDQAHGASAATITSVRNNYDRDRSPNSLSFAARRSRQLEAGRLLLRSASEFATNHRKHCSDRRDSPSRHVRDAKKRRGRKIGKRRRYWALTRQIHRGLKVFLQGG
jgi:hypothetical protein